MFPSLAAKFSYEDETGERGSFQITKVREAKTQYRFKKINTIYDWKSKELLTLDEYELKNKGTKTKLKTDLDMEKIDANNNFSVDDISNNIF